LKSAEADERAGGEAIRAEKDMAAAVFLFSKEISRV
jgi:hypothetical protein